jgi:hypothetical protein
MFQAAADLNFTFCCHKTFPLQLSTPSHTLLRTPHLGRNLSPLRLLLLPTHFNVNTTPRRKSGPFCASPLLYFPYSLLRTGSSQSQTGLSQSQIIALTRRHQADNTMANKWTAARDQNLLLLLISEIKVDFSTLPQKWLAKYRE